MQRARCVQAMLQAHRCLRSQERCREICSATRQGKMKQGRAVLGRAAGQGNAWQGRQAGQYLASKALGAVPNGVLVPTSPAANWSMLVLPTKMAPAKGTSGFSAYVLCKISLACYGLKPGSMCIMLVIISDELKTHPDREDGQGVWVGRRAIPMTTIVPVS